MKLDEIYSLDSYDYRLPVERIAPEPLPERTSSKLLVLSRNSGRILDKGFKDLKDFLREGDLLVFNDSRVIKARLFARKKTGGKAEILLLKPFDMGASKYAVGSKKWHALINPAKSLACGMELGLNEARVKILEKETGGGFLIEFKGQENFDLETHLEHNGLVPLPPYIERRRKLKDWHRKTDDGLRYQNVYAGQPGSVAAPTAGFHFDGEFIKEIGKLGVKTAFVTLHVGLGTFKPVNSADIRDHKMDGEWYCCGKAVMERIREAKSNGKRVVAVGTTSVRVLETVFGKKEERPSGWTDLFICPGYEFKAVDAMITNFHLPKSTLLMLASAFAGRENMMNAYEHAVRSGYRFYSYGDAMFIS